MFALLSVLFSLLIQLPALISEFLRLTSSFQILHAVQALRRGAEDITPTSQSVRTPLSKSPSHTAQVCICLSECSQFLLPALLKPRDDDTNIPLIRIALSFVREQLGWSGCRCAHMSANTDRCSIHVCRSPSSASHQQVRTLLWK